MLLRTRPPPPGFIEPCLPTPADYPPSGPGWIHEIKHDGYRMMVRRDASGVRLLTRNGKDWTGRFPTIVDAAAGLKARSCLIDGEAVCCDENGLAVFALLGTGNGPPKSSSTPSTCSSSTARTYGAS